MELQIPNHLCPKIPATKAIWSGETGVGDSVSPVGRTEGMSDRRGAYEARSCSHADQHSAQIGRIQRDWVYEGQERDTRGSACFETGAELRRAAIVGPGILCRHGGKKGESDSPIHPRTRGGGSPTGSVGDVRIGMRLKTEQIDNRTQ